MNGTDIDLHYGASRLRRGFLDIKFGVDIKLSEFKYIDNLRLMH